MVKLDGIAETNRVGPIEKLLGESFRERTGIQRHKEGGDGTGGDRGTDEGGSATRNGI
jgi:hypothetical protein